MYYNLTYYSSLRREKAFIDIEYVKIYIFQMGLGLTDSISWMNLQKKLDVIPLKKFANYFKKFYNILSTKNCMI